MKAKQIEKLLTGVVNNLVESIDVQEIRTIIKERTFITGGCIPSMLIGEYVNDFDFYFYNKEDADKVKEYYNNKTTGTTLVDKAKNKFHVKLITDNSINLSDKVQLITKFVGDPMVVVENFDFQHIKSWYNCKIEKLFLTPDVYQLVCEKELIYTGSSYPLSSLMRLKKYIKKGWNVSNATILHIALDFVEAMNKMESKRKSQHGVNELSKLNAKFESMSLEEFEELEKDIIDCNKGHIETRIDTETIQSTFNVDDVIHHLNGVDPITIQAELKEKTGECLTIKEIVELIK